jgi:hypothetical protein
MRGRDRRRRQAAGRRRCASGGRWRLHRGLPRWGRLLAVSPCGPRLPTYAALQASDFCFCRFPKGSHSANAAGRRQERAGEPARANAPQQERLSMNATAPSQHRSPGTTLLCIGCGKYHGSIGYELNCLRAAVIAARAALAERAARCSCSGQEEEAHVSR